MILAAAVVLAPRLMAADAVIDRFTFVGGESKDLSLHRAYVSSGETKPAAVPERLELVITRYATDAERDAVFSTASGGGKLADTIRAATTAGYVIWPGGSSYTFRYARRVPRTDGGHDFILIADSPMWAWWRQAGASADNNGGHVLQIRLNGQDAGEGKLALGATIKADKEAGVVIGEYAREPVVLADVRRETQATTTTAAN